MSTFKLYLKLLKKNLLIVLPLVAMFFLIGFIEYQNSKQSTERSIGQIKLPVGVINEAEDEAAKDLLNFLKEQFRVSEIKADELTQKVDLYSGKYSATLSIPANYQELLAAGEEAVLIRLSPQDQSSWQVQMNLESYLQSARALAQFAAQEGIASLSPEQPSLSPEAEQKLEAIQARLLKVSAIHSPVQDINKLLESSPESFIADSVYIYFRYCAWIVTQIILILNSFLMLRMNTGLCLLRAQVSAVPSAQREREIYLGNLIVGLTIWLLFVVPGYFSNGHLISRGIFISLSLKLLLYVFSLICISQLIVALCKKATIITGVSQSLALIFAAISGVFIPSEFLPELAKKLSLLFPMYYYAESIKAEADPKSVQFNLIVIALFGLASFLASLVIRARDQQSKDLSKRSLD
ncbi:MAG: ABC transporter permease [Eubacteriales bacterium]|nr:ABC transporter permease [Eubacteriales bacterium]